MNDYQVPLRGGAAEKERFAITQEDIDKVVHMVMEQGYSVESAVNAALKCTGNTFLKMLMGRDYELYQELKAKSRSNARANARKPWAGWDKSEYTNFWSLDEWKRRGLIKEA